MSMDGGRRSVYPPPPRARPFDEFNTTNSAPFYPYVNWPSNHPSASYLRRTYPTGMGSSTGAHFGNIAAQMNNFLLAPARPQQKSNSIRQ